jgi:hypothetical protein
MNNNFLTAALYPDGIRSHDPWLQSPRWQAYMIPQGIPRRQGKQFIADIKLKEVAQANI